METNYSLEQLAGSISCVTGVRGQFLTQLAEAVKSQVDENVYSPMQSAGQLLTQQDNRSDRDVAKFQAYIAQIAASPEQLPKFLQVFYERFSYDNPKEKKVNLLLQQSLQDYS